MFKQPNRRETPIENRPRENVEIEHTSHPEMKLDVIVHSLENLMEEHRFLNQFCRDSSEISHCLLHVSIGNSRFKTYTV
jgi:hypothetical protein